MNKKEDIKATPKWKNSLICKRCLCFTKNFSCWCNRFFFFGSVLMILPKILAILISPWILEAALSSLTYKVEQMHNELLICSTVIFHILYRIILCRILCHNFQCLLLISTFSLYLSIMYWLKYPNQSWCNDSFKLCYDSSCVPVHQYSGHFNKSLHTNCQIK